MYPRNSASPPPLSAKVVHATTGEPITSGVAAYYSSGGAQSAGGGSLAHRGHGVWEYTPTQGETDVTGFAVEFYHTDAVGDGPAITVATSTVQERMEEQVPSGPVIVEPPPPDAGQTTAWIQCLDENGAVEEGAKIDVRLKRAESGATVYSYDTAVASAESNASGLAYVAIPRSASLVFEARRDNGPWVEFDGEDADTLQLPIILGRMR